MRPWNVTELVGRFSGHVAIFGAAREKVAATLPAGLALEAQALTPAGTHPVIVWFGRQRDVHLTHLRRLPGFPLDYLEVIAGVPFVRRATPRAGGYAGSFLHLCQLFLDGAMAVFGGATVWGFPKKMARMTSTEGRFEARSWVRREPLIRCEAEPRGAPGPLASLPHHGTLTALLAQPLIEGAVGNLGPPIGSTFAWQLDEATAHPARVRIHVAERFGPALAGDHEVAPLGEAPLGALHITSSWRLSLPHAPEAAAAHR
jgi:hypothetical protein